MENIMKIIGAPQDIMDVAFKDTEAWSYPIILAAIFPFLS